MRPRKFLSFCVMMFFFLNILKTSAIAGPPQPETDPTPPHQPQELSLSATQAGTESIGSSTLQTITPAEFPVGSGFDICFEFLIQSPDAEYTDRVHVDLPDNWIVHSISPNSVPPANGCGSALPPSSGMVSGNVIFWESLNYPPQTGCGAWNGTVLGTLFNFCAAITIPDTSGAPWNLPWTIVGDGWGSEPHTTSGVYGPIYPVSPLSVSPDMIFTEGCPLISQYHTITVSNNTDSLMFIDFYYVISHGSGSCEGPISAAIIPHGTITPDIHLKPTSPPGITMHCDITATDMDNPANTDTTTIYKDVVSCYLDPVGWQLEPIAGATPNYWSAGVVGTHPSATGPVGYIIAGLTTGDVINPDLQMYNPVTHTWTQLPDIPNPHFGSVAGWIDNKLFVAGGFNTNFQACMGLAVFDPTTNLWDPYTPELMPNSRGGGAGGVGICSDGTGSCLFYVGGGPTGQYSDSYLETYQYDPSINTWTVLDSKPAGSSPDGFLLGAGVGCGGKIYVGGDYRGYHEFYVLDATQPSGSQWTQLTNIPPDAGAMTPTLICDEASQSIYLLGGDPDGDWGTYNDDVYRYDIESDIWEWKLLSPLIVGQLGSVGWNMGGRLWTVGGATGSGTIDPMPFEYIYHGTCLYIKWLNLPLIMK